MLDGVVRLAKLLALVQTGLDMLQITGLLQGKHEANLMLGQG